MNTNAVIFVLLLFAVSFIVLSLPPANINSITQPTGGFHYGSVVCEWKHTWNAETNSYGDWELIQPCQSNLITNAGLGALGSVLNGTTVNLNATWVALGNASAGYPLPTDTVINGEWNTCGLNNATGTSIGQGQGQWNVTKTFTSTCNNAMVNITGLYNSSKYGTGSPLYTGLTPLLFAEVNFTTFGTTLQANDQINVTWGIYITTSG
jgi:hypothetical protein